MKRLNKFLGVFALASAVFLTVSCAADEPKNESSKSPSNEVVTLVITDVDEADIVLPTGMNNLEGESELPILKMNGENISYTNAGSGSCAPILESANLEGEKYVLKEKEYPADTPCTMDFRIVQQTITRSDDMPIPSDADVDVVFAKSTQSDMTEAELEATEEVIEE